MVNEGSETYVSSTNGTLPVASGGTGTTTSTGSGSIVLSQSPSLTTPNLGSATAQSLTLSTPLPVSSGGTGQSSAGSNGQVLISNGTSTSWGSPQTGSVSSVGISVPSWLTVTNSPITSSGTIAISGSATGTGSVVLSTSPTISGILYTKAGDTNNGITYNSTVDGPSISGNGGGQLGYAHSGILDNASGVVASLTWSSAGVHIYGTTTTGTINNGGPISTGSLTTTGDASVGGNLSTTGTLTAGNTTVQNLTSGPGTVNGDLSVSGKFLLANNELFQTGTWTPIAGKISNTFTRISSNDQWVNNWWSKIGNIVSVSILYTANCSTSTNDSGLGFALLGLPFPAKGTVTVLSGPRTNFPGTSNDIIAMVVNATSDSILVGGGPYISTGTEVIVYTSVGNAANGVAYTPSGIFTSGGSSLVIQVAMTYMTP